MAFQIKAKLVYNKRISNNYFHCAFTAPLIAKQASPGQFVNIKVSDELVPLLRRPFSIHRVNVAGIQVLYEAVGEGTEILSQRKAGEYLDVIGPLGEGFNYGLRLPAGQAGITDYGLPILVAGGMGVAPLIFLAEKLMEIKNQKSPANNLRIRGGIPPDVNNGREKFKIKVLLGAKTKNDILCEREFKKLGCQVKIATDDGSRGYKGKVTDLLKLQLSASRNSGIPLSLNDMAGKRYPLSAIYACGPRPMLKAICVLSKEYALPAQVSLEEHLSCGLGACFGCTVNTKDGFKRVCKEGPVFAAEKIVWPDSN